MGIEDLRYTSLHTRLAAILVATWIGLCGSASGSPFFGTAH
jgi:hypothetical protein